MIAVKNRISIDIFRCFNLENIDKPQNAIWKIGKSQFPIFRPLTFRELRSIPENITTYLQCYKKDTINSQFLQMKGTLELFTRTGKCSMIDKVLKFLRK